MTTALITGINGQDGSYLAEYLVQHGGYRVVGLVRGLPPWPRDNLGPTRQRVELVAGDLDDAPRLRELVAEIAPDEVYHLAALSRVAASWDQPIATAQVNALGTLHLLEALRQAAPKARFVHAGSCEVFGRPDTAPQDETTPLRPLNPYGIAKAFAHQMTAAYRQRHGLFAVNAILYNHESPRRGDDFVTAKIAAAAARIAAGRQTGLVLGNLAARRDWGFAGDYVRAMIAAAAHPAPEDFVIGTGTTHSVEDFCRAAFAHVGLDHRQHITVAADLVRPDDNRQLVADPAKARALLGWSATTTFAELVALMVEGQRERLAGSAGR